MTPDLHQSHFLPNLLLSPGVIFKGILGFSVLAACASGIRAVTDPRFLWELLLTALPLCDFASSSADVRDATVRGTGEVAKVKLAGSILLGTVERLQINDVMTIPFLDAIAASPRNPSVQ